MSYANMIMYSAVLPSYKAKKQQRDGKKDKGKEEVIKADDRKNKDRVRKFLASVR